jgi:hypothetical protein
MKERLTPVQRLRQLEASKFRSGQTTTLFSSDMEKEPVRPRGGMVPRTCIYPEARAVRRGQKAGSLRRQGKAQWQSLSSGTAWVEALGALTEVEM